MTAIDAIALFCCVSASSLALLRWLRVAQREHYLASALVPFVARWWTQDPIHLVVAVVGLAGACASVAVRPLAFVPAVAVALFPLHLGLRGRTSKLAWTRRLRTLAATAIVLCSVPIALCAALLGLGAAVVASAFIVSAVPLVLVVALVVCHPIEEALVQRYVTQAQERLSRVKPTIVGITGSYGKTSTKLYLAHLLRGARSAVASPRSFNNRAGLARAVNENLTAGTDVFIAEMGTYGPGEIAALCSWLAPSIAVITAIGPVHLERFKTLERTLQAKSEIAEGAAVVVLNVDDDRLRAFADQLHADGREVTRCSGRDVSEDVAVRIDNAIVELFVGSVRIGQIALRDPALVPVATNVACAVAAALALGVDAAELVGRMGDLPEPENRLQVTRPGGLVLLDDTFNSNPAGARRALDLMVALSMPDHRRVVVTPGTVELGSEQEEQNAAFARDAAVVATDIILVGRTNRRALRKGIGETGREVLRVREVRTCDEAVAHVRASFHEADVVLYENDLPDHYP